MKTYSVYRFDYLRRERELVGKLVERRMKEREDNTAALLKLAQRTYLSPMDSHLIITSE